MYMYFDFAILFGVVLVWSSKIYVLLQHFNCCKDSKTCLFLSLSIPRIRIDVLLKELFLSYMLLFILELHGLRELHEEWYFKQHMDRDFTQVCNHR